MNQSDRGRRRHRVLTGAFALALLSLPGTAAATVGAPSPSATPSATSSPAVRITPPAAPDISLVDARVSNATGIALSVRHQGVVWVVSGGRLYAVDQTGRTVGAYTFPAPGPLHLRAVAMGKDDHGRPMLLLGDIGDPSGKRRNGVWLYTAPEPATLGKGLIRAVRSRIAYPDGPHDAGTLLVDPFDQRVYVVTLSTTGGNVYAVPSVLAPSITNRMTKVRPVHFVSQDGVILPDGRVILRGRYTAHVLDGIKGRRLAYLELPRQTADGPLAVRADGKSLTVLAKGRQSRLWTVSLPGTVPASTVERVQSNPGTAMPQDRIDPPSKLPGGVLGTASLAGLTAIGLTGCVFYLRRRSADRG